MDKLTVLHALYGLIWSMSALAAFGYRGGWWLAKQRQELAQKYPTVKRRIDSFLTFEFGVASICLPTFSWLGDPTVTVLITLFTGVVVLRIIYPQES